MATISPKTSRQPETLDYDVIIVGGGLAGLSLCCLLGNIQGLRVTCIDRDTPAQHLSSDERTTAISYGSSLILERAGVWAQMLPHGCPIEDIEILDGRESSVLLQFLSREVEGKPFGWIISNAEIRKTLMEKMAQLPHVTHITPARVSAFDVQENCAGVTLDDGRVLRAKLVVGADGRGSSVRDFMDVPVRSWHYNQQAVVCFVVHENPHYHKAVEHFWPQGPFAILPMNNLEDGRHCSSLVFTEHMARRGKQSYLMGLSDADFAREVAEKFPMSYGTTMILDNKRKAYPLSLVHAAHYIAPRMALVADAAHGIHPIAGQGLNLGFRDLGVLADLVGAAHAAGQDIGAEAVLKAYQRKRRPDNMAMIAVTDALVRLFSTNFPPVALARRAGLRVVAKLPAAKQFFMRKAMGS